MYLLLPNLVINIAGVTNIQVALCTVCTVLWGGEYGSVSTNSSDPFDPCATYAKYGALCSVQSSSTQFILY